MIWFNEQPGQHSALAPAAQHDGLAAAQHPQRAKDAKRQTRRAEDVVRSHPRAPARTVRPGRQRRNIFEWPGHWQTSRRSDRRADGQRIDRHAASRIMRRAAAQAGPHEQSARTPCGTPSSRPLPTPVHRYAMCWEPTPHTDPKRPRAKTERGARSPPRHPIVAAYLENAARNDRHERSRGPAEDAIDLPPLRGRDPPVTSMRADSG